MYGALFLFKLTNFILNKPYNRSSISSLYSLWLRKYAINLPIFNIRQPAQLQYMLKSHESCLSHLPANLNLSTREICSRMMSAVGDFICESLGLILRMLMMISNGNFSSLNCILYIYILSLNKNQFVYIQI